MTFKNDGQPMSYIQQPAWWRDQAEKLETLRIMARAILAPVCWWHIREQDSEMFGTPVIVMRGDWGPR